jgi:hypothetical protein
MVTDYEAAWIELMAHVASKTQHGRQDLLTKMAELAGEHRVAAGELSQMLRLYGVEVGRSRSGSADTQRFEEERIDAGFASAPVADSPRIIDRGGHDGNAGSSGGAGAGRAGPGAGRVRGRDGRRAGEAARA